MKLPKEFSLAEIAAVAGGEVEGPADTKVGAVALDPFSAKDGEIALIFDAKLVKRISECKASAVIVPKGVSTDLPKVVVDRPLVSLARILSAVKPKRFRPQPGIHPTAIIDPTCQLAENVAIGPYVVVGPQTKIGKNTVIMSSCIIGGGVSVGEDCLFYPACLIDDFVQIGNRVTLQQGVSLGSDGFGYVTERPSNVERRMAGITETSDEPNPLMKIPQIGTVIVEDDVEIGSYTTVDRATMGATTIGKGSKIDNQVMIAHNTRIGKEVIIIAQTAVAGSCVIGDRTVIAGCTGVKDHIKIGKDAIVEGMSGVLKDIPDNALVSGIPAVPARDFFTQLAHISKLPQIFKEVRSLKKQIADLESRLTERELLKQGDHAGN